MKIGLVTVTYGDRFHLIDKVITSALEQGVSKIILVDNNSISNSYSKLMELEKNLSGKLKVVHLDQNVGSAGGFKVGLEEATKDSDIDYIWILDDDNLPENNCLSKLKLAYNYLANDYKLLAISCIRYDRPQSYDVTNLGLIKNYSPNNFKGFNFFISLSRLFNSMFFYQKGLNYPLTKTCYAPYGGLFFSKQLVNEIGFPNEDFFVYADDHEFTYRITEAGGAIFYSSQSRIKDIDSSVERKSKIYPYFQEEVSEAKIYYEIRNHTFLSKRFIKNKFMFVFNMCVFYLHMVFRGFGNKKLFLRRMKLIHLAVKDGLNNNLGKKSEKFISSLLE